MKRYQKIMLTIIAVLVMCACFVIGMIVEAEKTINELTEITPASDIATDIDPIIQMAFYTARATVYMREAGDPSAYYELKEMLHTFASQQLDKLKPSSSY